jgi:hypothetical protein
VFQSFKNVRPLIFLLAIFHANTITVFHSENDELKRFHRCISPEMGFPVSFASILGGYPSGISAISGWEMHCSENYSSSAESVQ